MYFYRENGTIINIKKAGVIPTSILPTHITKSKKKMVFIKNIKTPQYVLSTYTTSGYKKTSFGIEKLRQTQLKRAQKLKKVDYRRQKIKWLKSTKFDKFIKWQQKEYLRPLREKVKKTLLRSPKLGLTNKQQELLQPYLKNDLKKLRSLLKDPNADKRILRSLVRTKAYQNALKATGTKTIKGGNLGENVALLDVFYLDNRDLIIEVNEEKRRGVKSSKNISKLKDKWATHESKIEEWWEGLYDG